MEEYESQYHYEKKNRDILHGMAVFATIAATMFVLGYIYQHKQEKRHLTTFEGTVKRSLSYFL